MLWALSCLKTLKKVAEKIVFKGSPQPRFYFKKRSLERKKDEFCNGKISPIAILASSLQRFFPIYCTLPQCVRKNVTINVIT